LPLISPETSFDINPKNIFQVIVQYGIITGYKSSSRGFFSRESAMIQCKDCELCEFGENGQRRFKCDPFLNVKEPECIAKWQLLRLDMLVASYQGMLKWYNKMAPLQDKLFKYMEKEVDSMDESERWKLEEEDEDENDEIE
jgi:hypothetical protein